jgi:hypothetical protein
VPVQQSIEFAAKLRKVIGDHGVRLELIQDAEHVDPKFLTPENVKKVLDFLDQYLRNA